MKRIMIDLIKLIFLYPISIIWDYAYRIRRVFYNSVALKTYKLSKPVLSVGNITFGGTGKTPFTIWLADFFEKRNAKPLILMRGYKGEKEGSYALLKGGESFKFNPVLFGDEALLIARRLKSGGIVLGKRRGENFQFYERQIESDVVILDDGFQHLKIRRSLNIVLFDSLLPINKYKVAPLGYLREGPTALKDADIIVLSRSDQATRQKKEELMAWISAYTKPNIPFAEIFYRPKGLFSCTHEQTHTLEELKGLKAITVAAVASPLSFFNLVESLGVEIKDRISFPDHHFFTLDDINSLLLKAEELDCSVIVSEKDIVKIRRVSDSARFLYIEIDVEFKSGQDNLERLLTEVYPTQ